MDGPRARRAYRGDDSCPHLSGTPVVLFTGNQFDSLFELVIHFWLTGWNSPFLSQLASFYRKAHPGISVHSSSVKLKQTAVSKVKHPSLHSLLAHPPTCGNNYTDFIFSNKLIYYRPFKHYDKAYALTVD